ncbi:MAG: polyisoprenoid-binding protein [Burkholderiaceae bacterium]|nr:polyisoprenoid-binding protein [Burkholderiaceae bacterium]
MRRAARGVATALRTAAFATASALAAADALAAPYTIDPTHTFVYFEWPAPGGLSTQRGRFDRTQGEAEFDRLGRSASVEVRIDTRSVSTGVGALDARLCSAGLLDCEAHRQAVFRAAQFGFDDSGLPTQASGSLTLRGRTAAITLKALRFNCYPNLLLLREVCGGDFEATIAPADFGIATGVPERIPLFVQIEAIKQ